ncbi:hypothetical protein OIU34_23405 [Pararhizobium sp. BT-229]|uniref:hypothetical protein n=1 Tax=Pararhizobium sp. BT-229 TaxID=2986923 RepID=UPI0021F7972E|nr:hypothetical protein [Pararhizobium sp. BT-229]MCV9964844.1 hypothetical protein [Pararhizobium sp. BT-229]
MSVDHFSDLDFNEDSPITLQEAGWMVDRLTEDLKLTDPHDPRYESLGHARFLWSEVRRRLEEGDIVTERPTQRPEFI